MSASRHLITTLFAICASAGLARANGLSGSAPDRERVVEFESAWPERTFQETSDKGLRIRIENGKPVPGGQFLTIFRKKKNIRCSMVLIGPRAAIAAAHCFSFSPVNVAFTFAGEKIAGKCYRYPSYSDASPDTDWALCKFDRSVPLQRFEAVNIRRVVGPNHHVVLMGYGCKHTGGPPGKVLRMGTATVSGKPANQPAEPNTIYVRGNVNAGEVALCEGDSGGPTFVFEGAMVGPRQIIGINSRVLRLSNGVRYSYVAATGTKTARQWIRRWQKRHNVDICGVNRKAEQSPCHGF